MRDGNDVESELRHKIGLLRSTAQVPDLDRGGRHDRGVRTSSALAGFSPLITGSVLALVVLAVAVGGGRSPSWPSDSIASVTLPHTRTAQPGDVAVCNDALLAGQLHGDPSDPRVAWLTGARGIRTDVDWPPDVQAAFAPRLELLRGGAVIAREGDSIRLGGGFGLSAAFEACEIDVSP